MGEMIKFGIKMALTIACAVALVAAIALLFSLIPTIAVPVSGTALAILDVFRIVSLVIPINIFQIFTVITSLFAFKVAYWAADKMIQFISAMG